MSHILHITPAHGIDIYVTADTGTTRFADVYDQAMTKLDQAGVLLPTNLGYVELIRPSKDKVEK